MKTIEYNFQDKSKYGEGAWQNEPDKIQWQDKETGLPCLIVRNHSGALCGYVGVPPMHSAYEKHYGDLDFNCHGGLTFSDFCQDHEHGICHIPDAGEPDNVWWLGFDCGHGGDIIPSFLVLQKDMPEMRSFTGAWGETYKGIAYVKEECKNLAKQLVEV